MKVRFVTGAPALPQMIGGSQRTSDALIHALRRRGHEVDLLSALMGRDWLGFRGRVRMKMSGLNFAVDDVLGYPVSRAWHPVDAIESNILKNRPDVVVVLAHSLVRMATAVKPTGVPMVLAFQDVEDESSGTELASVSAQHCVSNSEFTAQFYYDRFGLKSTVINPIIIPDNYRVPLGGKYITFVNPSPVKGLEVAIAIAVRAPELPFLFVEGWPLSKKERTYIHRRITGIDNITFRSSVEDMRTVFRDTRILLAPSQWQEAYGRVASEAQVSGIPVVGSDQGGLPEAIGPGGYTISSSALSYVWIEKLRKLYNHDDHYREVSDLALKHSQRDSLNFDSQVSAWESVLSSAVCDEGHRWTNQEY